MKRLSALLLSIGLCAATFAPSTTHGQRPEFARAPRLVPPAAKLRKNAAAIPNQYIVVLNDNSVAKKEVRGLANRLARAHGGTLGFTYENALRGFSVELNEAQAEALSRNPQVAFIEEDTLVEAASTQTNPTWALDRLDQRDLPASGSYTYASDGAGVNAYVIDGGIRMTHQEFGGRAAFAFDNVNDGRNGTDCNGHGTHVAGIIGGATYGVAKAAKLWSVRVLNCSNQAPAANVLAGIDWVAGNHVKPAVANLSFASGVGNDAMDLAVRNLITAGVTTVVAAGNNNGDAGLRSPARVTEAITVAATDQNDTKTSLSNFGSVVDVFAPGAAIVSAHSTGDAAIFTRTGTSSAAPFVAGLAARYLGKRPGDLPDAVSQAVTNDATVGKVINAPEGTPNRLAYAGITLSDDFNDNSRDASKWNVDVPASGDVVEQNGRLEVTPPASTTGYNGYYSVTTVDLTNTRVSVEVTPGAIGPYGPETHFTLGAGNDHMLFATVGSNILFQTNIAGVRSHTYVPYDATQHRIWRFRHNRTTDEVFWETSPDGAAWTVQRQLARPFAITNLQTRLLAGKYLAASSAGTTFFDNLWHEPNPTPPVVYADNFNDNVINRAMWVSDPNTDTVIKEQNGQLEVVLPPNTAGNFNTGLASPIDFRDKTAQVEVQPASQGGWLQTQFVLYLNDSNFYTIQTSNNAATADATVNGVLDRTVFTWDGSRFWRYRHDADANTVNFETSTDGTIWTTRKTVTVAAGFPLNAVVPVIGAVVWGTGNSTPGTAAFDNFRLERFQPRFPQSDNFNDNARDTKKWNVPATTDFTFAEQNGRLEITPGAAPNHEAYMSAATLDLTDARGTVEAVTVPVVSGSGTYFFFFDPNANNYLLIGVGGGTLLAQQDAGGVVSRTLIPYDAVQHRFWRIRHNRANDTINWETSADNAAWTVQRSAPRPFPITNLQTQLMAGKNSTAVPSMTSIFDNLQIERNEGGKAR